MAGELVKTKYDYFVNAMSKILEFRRDDRFCDLDVVVGSKVFKCHRLVLSAASKYFYAKLKRIMFDEGRSSATTKITLHETEVDIFELILELIYAGDVAIHRSNVYDLIRAANYYQVPSIVELCTKFVEENLNVLAEDVSKLLSFAHDMGLEQLEELLSGHVRKNFGHVDEFSKFTFESVAPISDTKSTNAPIMLTDAQEVIPSWFNRREVATFETELLQSDEDVVSFDRISAKPTTRVEMMRGRDPVEGGQLPEKLLHACVSRTTETGSPIGTSIYTCFSDGNISATGDIDLEWSYTGEMDSFSTFMKGVCIDGRLYSLDYLTDKSCHIDHQQTFCCSNSVSMNPSQSLRPPPYYLPKFDLCGMHNHIYVCTKYSAPIPRDINNASESQLSRGLFVYKRDVDRWFSLPCPTRRFGGACMTCNDDEIVYLIGGQNSNGTVYVYDPRLPSWFPLLNGTLGRYRGAACCSNGQKIYVAGGIENPSMVEEYDPIAGNWRRLRDLEESRMYNHLLVNWHSPIPDEGNRIVCFDQALYDDSTIEHLNPETNSGWRLMPDLDEVVCSSPVFFNDLFILDMINL